MKKAFILFSIFIFLLGVSTLALPTKSEAYFGVTLNIGNNGYNNYGGGWRDGYGCTYSYCGSYTSYGGDYNPAFGNFDNYGFAGRPMNYSNRATTSYYAPSYSSYSSRGNRQTYSTPAFREICTFNCYQTY